ncbi:Ankyrin repeat-containing protein C6C3.08 [Fusarium oxysporum f. sp. albedinis]|nr:Ankyrin repeat-containing protein C6C3.08 [Fusarium oxysporum f. sp. albedinis]
MINRDIRPQGMHQGSQILRSHERDAIGGWMSLLGETHCLYVSITSGFHLLSLCQPISLPTTSLQLRPLRLVSPLTWPTTHPSAPAIIPTCTPPIHNPC